MQDLSTLVQIDLQTINSRVQAAGKTNQARQKRAGQAKAPLESFMPALDAPPFDVDETPPFPYHANGRRPAVSPLNTEDHLLALLLHAPELFVWLASACDLLEIEALSTADFERAENREIYRTLKQFVSGDEPWDSESFQDELADQIHGHYGRIMAYAAGMPTSESNHLREDTAKTLITLRRRRVDAKNNELKQLQTEAQQNRDQSAELEYGSISNQIARERSHLDRLVKRLNEVLFDRGRRTQGVLIQ